MSESSFTLRLVNPCIDPFNLEAPRSLVPSDIFEYTLSSGVDQVTLNPHMVEPNYCLLTLDYEIDDPAGELVIASFDSRSGTFTFDYNEEDLAPLNHDVSVIQKDYIVTVTARTGLIKEKLTESSFILRVVSPCDAIVNIVPPQSLIGNTDGIFEYVIA